MALDTQAPARTKRWQVMGGSPFGYTWCKSFASWSVLRET
jgi:hypothetical protein